jgi:hypothetical protein
MNIKKIRVIFLLSVKSVDDFETMLECEKR